MKNNDLAECIGFDSYKNLVRTYGGASIYIYKTESLARELRNRHIRKAFDGDYKKFSRLYNLSTNQIREIIKGK